MKRKKLVEVADLDTLLGYEGNYMIFALKESNLLTLHMMQEYLEEIGDKLFLRDPDEAGDYTVDEIQQLAACLYETDKNLFNENRDELKELLVERLMSGPADDRVIVPTSSLYVEALVGTHPLLEDFKLRHRAVDVKKVQAEVRAAELENVRLAARALKGKDEDPDIERKIVVENGSNVVIDTE